MARRKRTRTAEPLSAKPKRSDQAPGEEVVQVNDKYAGDGPPPGEGPAVREEQHNTGG